MDGMTMGFIVRELVAALAGGRIDRIAQPDQDLVILSVRASGANHRLLIAAGPHNTRMHLTQRSYENPAEAPMFLMLLRKHLAGGRILALEQPGGDRLVRIDVSTMSEMGEPKVKQLYFEAMGRHTNLSLVDDGVIVDCARHITDDMSRVRRMMPGAPYLQPPGQDKLPPDAIDAEALAARLTAAGGRVAQALAGAISGLSIQSAREVALRLAGSEEALVRDIDPAALATATPAFFRSLPSLGPVVMLLDDKGLARDVFPFPFLTYPANLQKPQPSLSEALDVLYFEQDRHTRLMQRTSALRRTLTNAQARCEKKLAAQREDMDASAKMDEYRIAGELLTAYGHMAPRGADRVQLPNYYEDNKLLEIALDPSLTAAANAQKYFKKYRKASTARKTAAGLIENTLAELDAIGDALYAIEQSETDDDIAEVRQILVGLGILRREAPVKRKRKPKESKPLRFLSPDGFTIWVGKNNIQNERLLRQAQGDDIWLHARDIPGSHVIISTAGREVTPEALALGAKLAAYYSKSRGVRVPVSHTLRRYVKKPGGTPPGFVTFINDKLLTVSASEEEVRPYRADMVKQC